MRERTPGHWELRVFIAHDPATGKPGRATQTFVGTEKAAGKALSAFVAKVESGNFDRTTATVGQLLDKWLEFSEANQRQRPRTIYENRAKIEKRLRPRFGHIRLDRLKSDVLDTAYGEWLAEGLSPATVGKYHAILSAAFRQAVKWDWIDRPPTDRATPPSLVRREMVVPTPEQLMKLVTAAEKTDPVLASAIALAALTGMRRGELVALRWSDIDLKKRRLKVSKSLTVASGEQHIGPTKTHASRELALDPVCVRILELRWAYASELAELSDSSLVDDPYVLSYNANCALPASPDTLTHRFGNLCRKMEEPAINRLQKTKPGAAREDLAQAKRWSFRFHDLRHFSVTTLVAAGVDIRTVAERHGHARATMTLDLYAHALPERDREAADILGRTLNW